MSKFIAVKSGTHEILPDAWHTSFSQLKQQTLLFDQIGIFKLNSLYKALTESADLIAKLNIDFITEPETIIQELQWLQQEKIVFDLNIQDEFTKDALTKTRLTPNFERAKELLKKVLEIQEYDPIKDKNNPERLEMLKEQQFSLIRLLAIIMEATKGVSAVTTAPYTEYTNKSFNSHKSDVVQIVIKKLPLPSNETPWEQIIDYRNDPNNQKNLSNLRRWIRKTATENLPQAEIEEEIESLINDFNDHMKFHKIKANSETLETYVKSPLEFLEFKPSKIIEPLFALRKRNIYLMEAELNAPGREMAYILKAKEKFQSSE